MCGIIVLYLLLTVFAFGAHGELDCIAVNERNGDVAISFYKEAHAYVKVFDAEGNELFTCGLDSGGGLISYMYFEDDVLHVQNTRMSREILYDRNGEMITAFDICRAHGIIVAESAADKVLPPLEAPYRLYREYRYGQIKLTVFHRDGNED